MRDNTYIFFTSDHGEMLGDHGLYTKSLPYESALRVPLIAAGPGIRGWQVSDALVELIDVNPTICALAGLPPQPGIDALSFDWVLNGDDRVHRTETVSAIRNFRLIRTHDYKLVQHYNDHTELYNLNEDPEELHNIADAHPDVVGTLRQRLNERYLLQP